MSTHQADAPAHEAAEPPVPTTEDRDRRRKLIALILIGALLLIVALGLVWYLITKRTITDIPGLNSEAMPRYNYSIYGVEQPMGVAVSPDGERIYVTQSGGTRTTVAFDHEGHQLAVLAPPRETGADHIPVYIAINPVNNDVYVSDRMAGAVYEYTESGTYRRTFKPTGLTGTWAPLGLAFAEDGTLYVTEVGGKHHRVLVIDPSGKVTAEFKATDLEMVFPNGAAAGADGVLAVADGNNGRLLFFDATGRLVGSVNRGIGKGDLGLPRGVATDSSGRYYAVDTTNHTVHIYRLADPSSHKVEFVGAFGDEGIQDGAFEYPNGIATDTRSNVYVTDRENNRVQVWTY
jgi:DNA-binding beta-propeller fold protein YncE